MSVTRIGLDQLFELLPRIPVLDVRSPAEFQHAQIPGAISFPLFTNEERILIGTTYKQESREKAIKIGLQAFGPNMLNMVETAEQLLKPGGEVIVHCWRGGMRSAAVAWLLDLYGFKVYQLDGGYKSFRRWALAQFEKQYPLSIISGYTGSNKTGILQELKKQGHAVIDLEAIAGHRGSAFGNLNRIEQPSQEQFENLLAIELYQNTNKFPGQTIWMESETQRIGQVNIPHLFYNHYQLQPYYFVEVPFEERLKHIVEMYGSASKESLINAIVRITKKLGGGDAKAAIGYLVDDDVHSCFTVLLQYYDRSYHKNERKRRDEKKDVVHLHSNTTNAVTNLNLVLEHARRKQH